MGSKRNNDNKVKNLVMSEECNYTDIYNSLLDDYDNTLSGILNTLLYLFRNIDEDKNEEKVDNLILILNRFVKSSKSKKDTEIMYNKIDAFLNNIDSNYSKDKLKSLYNYTKSLSEIQNKCLSKKIVKNRSDKYNFLTYLIFEKRDIELLHKYMLDNMKEFISNNSLIPSVFLKLVEEFISLDSENYTSIKYYNQVFNLFLRGKLYNKLLKGKDNEFMLMLKNSDKDFVIDLVEKIENDFCMTREEVGREYSVFFDIPNDKCEYKNINNKVSDYTYQDVITIDGEDDLCLDDGLFIEKNDDGTYTLYIHLANPTSIMTYNSDMMQSALKRSETIYLADRDIPLYGEYLSNNVLSLLPGKNTNAFTFVMKVDTDYSIIMDSIRVENSIIRNKHRLTYDTADNILKNEEDPIYEKIELLSRVISRISKDNIDIKALHKIDNIVTGRTNTNSYNSDISMSHSMVEDSMIFVNRLPYIFSKYNNLYIPYPYRVQPVCDDEYITKILRDIDKIDVNNTHLRRVCKNYMSGGSYSDVNIKHANLGVDGYVRISSPARRALDAMVMYILNDLYINRNGENLDYKYYYWENEIKYWCYYTNNRISYNNNFMDQYNYLLSKGKILERKLERSDSDEFTKY